MKRVLLAGATLLALTATQPTLAADAPVYKGPAPYAAALFNWSGFYVGGNVGVAWLDKSVAELSGSGLVNTPPFDQSLSENGFTGGLQVGYNWQVQSWIVGVEADFNWTDIHKTVPANKGITDTNDFLRGKADWFATFRGRIGYVFDRWMPYFTGGAAVARLTNEYGDTDTTGDLATVQKTRWGWTVGGGTEIAFAPNWTAKLEYLYMDFGNFQALSNDGLDPDPVRFKDRMHVVRLGVNYRWGATPVAAR